MVFLGIDWGPIVTDVFYIVFPVLLAWALAEVHKFLPALTAKYQAAFTTEQRHTIEAVARTGVIMAEQLASRPDIHDLAMSKKELAFQFVDKALAEKHIAVSAGTISGEIEAAVYDEFNSAFVKKNAASQGPVKVPVTSATATAFVPVGIAPVEVAVTS